MEYRRPAGAVSAASAGWTEARVALLRKLWAEGFSASQIAARLGQVTRNAVIGKVHRLGLAGRSTTSRIMPGRKPKALSGRHVVPRLFIAGTANLRRVPAGETSPIVLITLLDLRQQHCRWPIGDNSEDGVSFCGRQKADRISYCEYHAFIAFKPPAGRNGKPARTPPI